MLRYIFIPLSGRHLEIMHLTRDVIFINICDVLLSRNQLFQNIARNVSSLQLFTVSISLRRGTEVDLKMHWNTSQKHNTTNELNSSIVHYCLSL